MKEKDITTEEHIKEVARKLFHEKGYAATRTREIAEAANINSALLNYYFRSKERLFEIIMLESMQDMFLFINEIINDKATSISYKFDALINRYFDVLTSNPNLPLFVLSELQANQDLLLKKTGVPQNIVLDSFLYKQLETHLSEKKIDVAPLQIFVNIISLIMLPIVAKPVIKNLNTMSESDYKQFIEDRRKLVPVWIRNMIEL